MNVERNLLGNFESDIVRAQNLLLSRANTRRNGRIKTIRNEILDMRNDGMHVEPLYMCNAM